MTELEEPGLRERQKQLRRIAVLDAARQLFEERGVDATTIEEIAGRAMVSPATIYNYFVSKNDLLLALFEHEWSDVEVRLAKITVRAGDDAVSAMTRFVEGYNRIDESFGPPRLWRQLIAASFTASAEVRTSYQQIGDRFETILADRLRHLVTAGLLRPDTDTEALARSLSAIADADFHRRVRVHERWTRTTSDILRRQIRQVLQTST
ncbi:helix-turn-helix domain-containing protein [Dactylosporangium sp. AC04546]|uniref:TetR/AcrR family transcriptional regulator n=1 Tax=Dactylosporangium sp. AC04546 TaxID=2862460 RepID=UPI001EDE5D25|nr:TetR/AcrR family transcriptional regulator [Dactylosporangium sp. AC04546]WVK80970.1 helix-turn-helix domain-containing protein [Dactylosporangium sp. AC04546]